VLFGILKMDLCYVEEEPLPEICNAILCGPALILLIGVAKENLPIELR
jgi:hypothetical protein